MISLNIFVLGGKRQLIENLFPNVEKTKEKREIRFNKRKDFYWRAFIFPEVSDSNNKEIRTELKTKFNNEEKEIKKNVLLFFGEYEIKKFVNLINNLEQPKRPLILFISAIKKDYSQFSDIRLVTFLKEDNDETKIYNKILSYLWEKDCYFNERGNCTCKLSQANLLYKKPKGFTFLNILLLGLKRSGKSSLINIISKKLTALELPFDQSVTKKITEYEIYPFEEEEKYNITSLKFYDTPGIENTKKFNSEKIIINFLEKKFNEINLIYFIKREGAIEDCQKVFEKIVSLNKERIKKDLPKIPIIFLINGVSNVQEEKTSVAINTIKDYLTNNFSKELYDENEKGYNKNIINDDSDSDDDENYKNKKYVDGNIIRVNLRKQKDEHSYSEIYGMDNLFKKSLEYLKSTNSLKIEDLNKLREKNVELINLFKQNFKQKQKHLIKDKKSKLNSLTRKIMKENSLLMAMPLLHKYYEDHFFLYITFTLIGCLIFWCFGLGIPFIVIGLIFTKKTVLQIALEYGFDENDIKNYGLEEYIFSEIKVEENNENELKKNLENTKNSLEKLLLFTNGYQLYIKSFEIYQNVFKSLEKFGNMDNEEWNKFKENEI